MKMIVKYEAPVVQTLKTTGDNEMKEMNNKFDWNFHQETATTYEGYLYIQNKSFWRLPKHAWKRKYFTLKNDCLYITDTKSDKIENSTCIKIDLDTGIYPLDNLTGKPRYYIRITCGKQNYTLFSMEEENRDCWITSLLTSMSNKLLEIRFIRRKSIRDTASSSHSAQKRELRGKKMNRPPPPFKIMTNQPFSVLAI